VLTVIADWRRTFPIYWRDYQEPFLKLLEGIDIHAKHLDLLAQHEQVQHAQDTSSQLTNHFLQYQDDREGFRRFLYRYEDERIRLLAQAAKQEEERKHEQYSKVQRWLSNPGEDQQTYQDRWRTERDKFPGTSSWILESSQVTDWMDKEEPNSILWVYGNKGAGKTILASRIIENLRKEKTGSTTSFFYCREDDLNESGKCLSLYKSLLRQLLEHKRRLLPLYYEKKLKSQEILNNEADTCSLLKLCFEEEATHFIVIDGLDEFCAADRTNAVKFIRSIVDKSDNRTLGKIRVLFMSQDLKEMRTLLPAAETLEIQPSHVEPDIRILVTRETELLASEYRLKACESERVIQMTVAGARGIFSRYFWPAYAVFY